jgi:2-polyprenyl-3-methyl-5-hydroxy-6-metoxy-1,4-benzoquinol methylase
MKQFLKVGEFKNQHYKDFQILAHEDLHSDMMKIISKNSSSTGKKTFDVASGQGSFSARLKDNGFEVHAADIDQENFRAEIPFTRLDLNDHEMLRKFAEENKGKFDNAVSLETIEHIHDPWLFLSFLKEILNDDGTLFVSTPNTESIFSRISFLVNGKFHQFYEGDLSYGHINPMTSHHLKVAAESVGLEVQAIFPVGTYPIIHLRKRILFSIGWSLGNLLFYPFVKGYKTGWALCYIIRKKR